MTSLNDICADIDSFDLKFDAKTTEGETSHAASESRVPAV